jgi:hypothetical protein
LLHAIKTNAFLNWLSIYGIEDKDKICIVQDRMGDNMIEKTTTSKRMDKWTSIITQS